MTWRRFCVLLAGLSPNSVWRTTASREPEIATGERARQLIETL